MGVQTLTDLDAEVLIKKADSVIIFMANNQTAKERFDIGCGYNEEDYSRVIYLRRLLKSTDTEILESFDLIKSELNKLKNKYL